MFPLDLSMKIKAKNNLLSNFKLAPNDGDSMGANPYE